MVPRSYTLIDHLILLDTTFDSSVYKLSHFQVVCKHVDGQVSALCNRDELLSITVVVRVLLVLLIDIESIHCT